jgi:death-on-curing protein
LPRNKAAAFPITAAYIEFLHDKGIAVTWPGVEPVQSNDVLDRNLLESAPQQPFQSGFGVDLYPTIYDKAACLFFSIVANHIFTNGNKRTGVLALDQFLLANSIYLLLDNDEIRELAEWTAKYRERGDDHKGVLREIENRISHNSVRFANMRDSSPEGGRKLMRLRRIIRHNFLNDPSRP